jgi:hypothetical protein
LSISWHLDGTPSLGLLVLPPAAVSLDEAHAAIELWEHYTGKTLDAAQRLTVEVMMAQDVNGNWAASTTGREMARQNGKGDEVEVVELWGLVQRSEAILHTLHEAVLLATQTQQRMLGVLEGHGDLRRRVKRKWMGIGQQMIEMRNGGVIWYRTRTGPGGRGVDDIDRLVVDEAQHAEQAHLDATTPTLLANPNPQMNVLGTAGLEGKSAWWWQQRRRALSPVPGSFGYVGHTAEQVRLDGDGRVLQSPVDVFDRELWLTANPAVAAGRGQGMRFLEEQLMRLGPSSFAREHLCVWDPEPDAESSVISAEVWAALLEPSSTIASNTNMALDVSPDRRWSSFGVAGRRSDDRLHLEVVDRRPGTAWVLARGVELARKHKLGLRIQKGSPADSFIAPFREIGVDVVEVSKGEHAQAVGQFIDAAMNDGLRHIGQAALDAALPVAQLQPSGDVEVWGRRTSKADICGLVSVTLALGGVPQVVSAPLGAWR